MEKIPESLCQRMPQDLLQYVLKQKTMTNIPVSEKDPADVATEVISAGPFEMKAFFPSSTSGNTVVFMHLPGGICKRGINRDQGWCSNMANDSGSIYVSVDYPSALEASFRQILTDCQYAYELIRRLCEGPWKATWNTHPARIVLSGSSIGATLAISIAAIVARNGAPAFGLIGIVPLIATDPVLANDPWGENESTLGLTPDRLLAQLKTTFDGEQPGCRDHWHSNPDRMPDQVVIALPKTTMILAKLDILYKSQEQFVRRLLGQGVEVDWIEVAGLHYVKDMDTVTDAGRAVRRYIKNTSIEYTEYAEMWASCGRQ
ncbi:alpha/beta-hydrolase [Melanomma pulvis-pyrius CBS 109.77]|uniref:Alpha/beta-hydrolase n=1 Tax=Melanomma pulvis-pyrius CBS 109.77 TaxID=1314802 RepID=A0A6A6WZS5_9PLEO|nr:alpha/beta-hydrolase [Melanomma pulvis-pyrius CBS 109.77]